MTADHYVAYLSPHGSTERVATAFSEGLSHGGPPVSPTDLADPEATTDLLDSMAGGGAHCLLLGSPVYFNRAVPPVMVFIDSLPPSQGSWAVPFVTYGKACSGLALWQMALALQKKGYKIAGAAKVLAVHSLMWESEDPEGGGHPDEDDLGQVQELARILHRRSLEPTPQELSLAALDYHPEELTAELREKLGQPWPIMPKTVTPELCTECGTCADECPVTTITLDPLPVFGASCIDCFNCISLCPEEAISPETPLHEIGAMVRTRVRNVNETPGTQIFFHADT